MQPHLHKGQPTLHAGVPLEQSRGVLIMLHGRGASPRDILDLQPYVSVPGVSYLAPAAAGHTWYPYSFLSPIDRNEPYLTSALEVVGEVLAHVEARGIPRERTVLLGFSQGACLVLEYAVRHPARYGGIVAFSGGLIGPPGTTWPESGAFDRTPVFLGCSDVDPHIPLERVTESAAVFARMGADVSKHIYPNMGHTVNEDEIARARGIIAGIVS
jgi:phospholipase/carboxylesterase